MNGERRVLRAPGFVPIEAKLRFPDLRDRYVRRGQIIDRLRASTDVPVLLVTAPPGYGKTITIAQWAAEDSRPFAWLELDDCDNDPIILFTYLLLALQRIEPVDAGILTTLTGNERSITDVALPRLGRMLARRCRPFVLVLDEADALTSPTGLSIVNSLARHLPVGSQLVVIARTAIGLNWSQMRAKRRLMVIDTNDLRLNRAEALALIDGAGLHARADDVDALLDRVEGWAAATYLATLPTSQVVDHRHSILHSLGSDSVVASYLRDEFLASRPPDEQAFLRRTSILDTLCGPLCDAVLSTSGSDTMLRRLERSNAHVSTVPNREGWYRVHPLLADVLKSELHRLEPQLTKRLHAQASSWFEENGDVEHAIDHATAATEIERAARLIWAQTVDCVATGRIATLERWLGSFGPRQVAGHAELALAATWSALQRGLAPDPWLSAAEQGADDQRKTNDPEAHAAATRLLHAAVGQKDAGRMRADAEHAMRLEAPDDPWRCVAKVLDGTCTYLTGEPLEAHRKLAEADRLADAFGNPHVRVQALAQSALIAIDSNDWGSAHDLVGQALALMDQYALEELPDLISAHCTRALLAAKQGLVADAAALSRQCMSRLASCAYLPAWQDLQARYLLARTELMIGHPAVARRLLSEAGSLLADVSDAIPIRDAVSQLWAQIEKMPLMADGRTPTLTTAELRVLQALPTHYSFEQIGRQFFVSRNTVKTQAVSAYRKLGVSSRTEAVERAYALGLISR